MKHPAIAVVAKVFYLLLEIFELAATLLTHSTNSDKQKLLMRIEELIGKTIKNIYSIVEYENYGLDKGECFIELDNKTIIDIPFGESQDIWIKDLDPKAKSIFNDLSDYPFYHVNKDRKSIKEIADNYQRQKHSFLGRLKSFFGQEIIIKEYQPHKVEYRENKLKYIQNKLIVDILWYADEIEKAFIELDNGYIITETKIANNGNCLAGLNYYQTINDLTKRSSNHIFRLTDKTKGSS